MKKITTLLMATMFALTLGAQTSNAQDASSDGYLNTIGLRLGYPSGIAYQHFFGNNNAFEGIAAFYYGWGANFDLMYEYHAPIGTSGFGWYVGGGLNIMYYTYTNTAWGNSSIGLGVDLIGGLQYKFGSAPFVISADWKPTYSFMGYNGFLGTGGAITLRYTF